MKLPKAGMRLPVHVRVRVTELPTGLRCRLIGVRIVAPVSSGGASPEQIEQAVGEKAGEGKERNQPDGVAHGRRAARRARWTAVAEKIGGAERAEWFIRNLGSTPHRVRLFHVE